MSLWQDIDDAKAPVYIAAVNHKRSGSVIELFKHKVGSTLLTHMKTIKDEKIIKPNDVALVGPDSFYVTNDVFGSGVMRTIQLFGRFASGNVVFYDGETTRVVLKSLVYPNGIALSPNFEHVYLVSTTNRKLQIYERKSNDGLKLLDTIDVGLLGDNIGVDHATGAIYLAGHSHGLMLEGAAHDLSKRSPTKLVKITNNTGEDQVNTLDSANISFMERSLMLIQYGLMTDLYYQQEV